MTMSKPVRLIRYGGLSPVTYKVAREKRRNEDGSLQFHCPPRRKGIFCFVWPHMDLFFVVWHDKGQREVMHEGLRDFYYDGPLWTHLSHSKENQDEIEWVGCWREVSTEKFHEIWKRHKHECNSDLVKDGLKYNRRSWWGGQLPTHPYIRGRSGWGITYAVDSLEIFIEKKHLGKIR
jgi:hypothetical protein